MASDQEKKRQPVGGAGAPPRSLARAPSPDEEIRALIEKAKTYKDLLEIILRSPEGDKQVRGLVNCGVFACVPLPFPMSPGDWRKIFPKAHECNISGRTDLKDEDFKHLGDIRVLNMSGCAQEGITNKAFEHLSVGSPHIFEIDMSGCGQASITVKAIDYLASTDLEHLKMDGCGAELVARWDHWNRPDDGALAWNFRLTRIMDEVDGSRHSHMWYINRRLDREPPMSEIRVPPEWDAPTVSATASTRPTVPRRVPKHQRPWHYNRAVRGKTGRESVETSRR